MMEYTKEQQEQLQLISTCATIDEAVEKLCAADSSLTAEQAKAILAELGVGELEDAQLGLVAGGFDLVDIRKVLRGSPHGVFVYDPLSDTDQSKGRP